MNEADQEIINEVNIFFKNKKICVNEPYLLLTIRYLR